MPQLPQHGLRMNGNRIRLVTEHLASHWEPFRIVRLNGNRKLRLGIANLDYDARIGKALLDEIHRRDIAIAHGRDKEIAVLIVAQNVPGNGRKTALERAHMGRDDDGCFAHVIRDSWPARTSSFQRRRTAGTVR